MITTHMRKETKKRGIQWSSAFRYILLCSIVTASVSCSDRKDEKKSIGAKELTTFNGTAMTINYHVDVGQKLTGEEKSRCEKIIKSSFSEIDEIYNKWNPQSELSQINQARSGKKIKVSKKLINFLQKCDHFVTLSNGRFDPTIEPIQALWKKQLEQNREPTEQEIEKLRPAIGWDKLIIEPDGVTKKHPLTQLDLSAIAKGYAIDLITERLNAIGLHDLFIDWGGEIRATGNHPQGRHWTVYIANLNDTNPENALAYTPLIDQSIATSGDYLQQWTVIHPDGTTTHYTHVFDPKTLRPLEITKTSVASASVLVKDCQTADALATMLLLCPNMQEAKELAVKIQKEYPDCAIWLMGHSS